MVLYQKDGITMQAQGPLEEAMYQKLGFEKVAPAKETAPAEKKAPAKDKAPATQKAVEETAPKGGEA